MKPTHRKFGGGCSYLKTISLAIVVSALLSASLVVVHADGLFVFKWDKQTDINEPTQKAIIVYDAGREDLLLQVKYEGPLEEFGWLIPVPSLPKIEMGSMDAFYNLSRFTQFYSLGFRVVTMSASQGAADDEAVKAIQIKTVGAYEVAVLSARDAGSLDRWLRANDYSIPDGKREIVDDYIHRGWYFIAARIQLNDKVAFKTVTTYASGDTGAPGRARKNLQGKLNSGELHPLLISFDTPTCVFPLKISSVGGKPSEISLYVLSAEALLNPFMFDEALGKIEREHAETERLKPERDKNVFLSTHNMRMRALAYQLYTIDPDQSTNVSRSPDWKQEDLDVIAREAQPATVPAPLDENYYSPLTLLDCVSMSSDEIRQSTKSIPRLKDRNWFLSKYTRTFQPNEMRDLDFQPAIPILAKTLSQTGGARAAEILSQLGTNAVPVLISACRSTNSSERTHASAVLQSVNDPRLADVILALLKDDVPQVRYHAVQAAENNWDPRFVDPLIALFRDPHPEICGQAARCVARRDALNRTPVCIELLHDPDPTVQACALQMLRALNRTAIPRADLLRLLGSPRLETVSMALDVLQGPPLFRNQTRKNWISSMEAAPLTTNSLTIARLMGLQIFRLNADTEAVDLSLPLLSDTNSIVRSRAVTFLRAVSGQDFPQSDRAKWELWWSVNRATFHPRNNSD